MAKSVFVLILGETNAGKSTFINGILDAKVSAISHKVQTTRSRVVGIHTEEDKQIIFIDTPGIFKSKRKFDEAMIENSYSSIQDADIVVVMIDAAKGITNFTEEIIKKIPENKKTICLFNKIDLIKKDKLLSLITHLSSYNRFDEFFMISALKKEGTQPLISYFHNNMVHDNFFYEEDQISDLPVRQLATEITREKVYKFLNEELPYNIVITPDLWEETENHIKIYQTIYVVKKSHKAIVLGNKGEKIKQIRLAASDEISTELEKKISLFLYVKVDKKLFEREATFKSIGLDFNS